MGKFCEYCGAQLDSNAAVCASCGASVVKEQPAYQQPVQQGYPVPPVYVQAPVEPPKKKKAGKIIGIILAVLAVAVVAFVLIGIFADEQIEDYQQPVEDWMAAIEENDVDKMYGAYYDCWDEIGFSESQVKDEFQYIIDYYDEELEDEAGDDYEITVEYGDMREYEKDEIEELYDILNQVTDLKIDAAYEVEATLTAEGDKQKVESDEYTFVVVQVDDEWSIIQIRGLPFNSTMG